MGDKELAFNLTENELPLLREMLDNYSLEEITSGLDSSNESVVPHFSIDDYYKPLSEPDNSSVLSLDTKEDPVISALDTASRLNRNVRISQEAEKLSELEMDAYKRAYEPASLNKTKAWALALPTILGTLIGAAYKGKKGAAVGMQAGATGSLLGLQGEKQDLANQSKLNLLTGQTYGQRRQEAVKEAQREQDLLRQEQKEKNIIDYRLDETTAEMKERESMGLGPNRASEKPIGEALSQQLGLPPDTTVAMANIKLRSDMQGMQSQAEKRRTTAMIAKLAQSVQPGYEILEGVQPPPQDRREMAKLESARLEIQQVGGELKELLKNNGADFLGNTGKYREQLVNYLVTAQKNLDQMGANFTIPEIGIVKGKLPDIDTFEGYLKSLALGRNPQAALDSFLKLTNDVAFNRAIGYGYWRPSYKYNKDVARDYGYLMVPKWYDSVLDNVGPNPYSSNNNASAKQTTKPTSATGNLIEHDIGFGKFYIRKK